MEYSVVLPVYNEEYNIVPLLREIVDVFEKTVCKSYEIVIIDDASSDRSAQVIQEYQDELKVTGQNKPTFLTAIHCTSLSMRAGQSHAILLGINLAQGKCIITMDSDLQHDPADISRLIDKMEMFDMVCGIRRNRADGMLRLILSKIANGFRNAVTGDTLTDSGCTFRIMKRECIPFLQPLEGQLLGCEFFFYPLFIRRAGFLVGELEVAHRARGDGNSKYQLVRGRFWRGLVACVKVQEIIKTQRKKENR